MICVHTKQIVVITVHVKNANTYGQNFVGLMLYLELIFNVFPVFFSLFLQKKFQRANFVIMIYLLQNSVFEKCV